VKKSLSLNTLRLFIFLFIISIIFGGDAYAQQYSSDGDTMYVSGYAILRNPSGYISNTPDTCDRGFPGLTTEWGNVVNVSNGLYGDYFNPAIVAGDSILHVFCEKNNPTPYAAHHYISTNNGLSWTFFADYYDPTMNIRPGHIRAYYDPPRLCTVWWGRHGTENGFIYFRASTDDGNTWPITKNIVPDPYIWRDARDGNIAGHGDTLFVCLRQDSLTCWRSIDLGRHWYNPGYFAGGPSLYGREPWITYKIGIVSILFQDTFQYNSQVSADDVFYVRSLDKGLTWDTAQFLGFPDYQHGQGPEMAADDYGNIAICWMDYIGSPYMWTGGIWCRISHDSGTTWQPAVRMDSTYLGKVGSATAIDGDYVSVVWAEESPNRYLIYRESRDGGLTWGQRQYLSQGNHSVPDLIKKQTDLHLVWQRESDIVKYMQNAHVTSINDTTKIIETTMNTISTFPNPFNSSVVLKYPNNEGGEIGIYNILGQQVKALRVSLLGGQVVWDGTDKYNISVPSGVYFARVKASEIGIGAKLLLLR
jgi:hypothetical protein